MTIANCFKAMDEFKDQLDSDEKDKVMKLAGEVREVAVKGQTADPSITADIIREKVHEMQKASLGLFQKVGKAFDVHHVNC